MTRMRRSLIFGAALTFLAIAADAQAEQIVVSNYGVSANGMPYAVALAKGFFKAQGADVTGILSSDGGGTTVRNQASNKARREACGCNQKAARSHCETSVSSTSAASNRSVFRPSAIGA